MGVDFAVTKQSRLDNKVRGTKKRGGIWLDVNSPLCEVTCANGSKFKIFATLRGHLLEINRRLVDTPQLLTEKPLTEGYVAIIRPKNGETFQHLLTLEAYQTRQAQTDGSSL